ncbi:protein transport protein HofC [Utexia brackfieldae]|uniref:protein transport protein HofC n=1 Tax=Utexia brackfieldae TaxID=3074108 RepID=UPI00370D2231
MRHKRIYLWHGFDENHHFIKGEIAAYSKIEAKKQLLMTQNIPTKVNTGPSLSSRHFDQQTLLIITRQLMTMLNAGLPLIDTLMLLVKQQHKSCWRLVLSDITQQVTQGCALSEALKRYSTIFSPLYQQLVITGEITGQLTGCLDYLLIQQENRLKLQKKIKKALRYPCFLSIMTLLISIIMLTFVIPQFVQIYASFDAELPYFTRLIIQMSTQLSKYGILLLFCITFIILIIRFVIYPKYRLILQIKQLKIPILGDLLRKYYLALLFHNLCLTQKSGIPLLEGLNSVIDVINYQAYQVNLREVKTRIEQGLPLSQAMDNPLFYPKICQQFIAVGETSGTLDNMLEKLATYYQIQIEEMTENLTEKVEPMMMMIIGIIVGGLVIAIYLPIFQLGNIL